MSSAWWLAIDGHQVGPLDLAEIRDQLAGGSVTSRTLGWRSGMTGWKPLGELPELAASPPATSQVPPVPGRGAHEIDFRIRGAEMQYVEVDLDPGESVVAEAGAMMFVQSEIEMDTIFGDGSAQKHGLFDALVGAGKRLLTGESLFMTVFTNRGSKVRTVAFAAPYPGKILAMDLRALGGELLCQKDAFLCAAKGVALGIAFQKRFGTGLFGGEGFILQRLEGDGLSFVHAGGTLHALELAAGESLRVDTGCVVALAPTIQYDIEYVGKLKTALFGGEGLFFARLAGPGKVWLQSLPFSRLADRVWRAAPQTGGRRVGEGSILDKAFGLGNLLDGDG